MTASIRIRAAGLPDFEGIRDLYLELDELHARLAPEVFRVPGRQARSNEFFAEAMDSTNTVLAVALAGDRVVGVALARIREASSHAIALPRRYGVLEDLVISAPLRRRGIGRDLIEHVEQWAHTRGVDALELGVWELNDGARAFYESVGYGTQQRRMSKLLSDPSAEGRPREAGATWRGALRDGRELMIAGVQESDAEETLRYLKAVAGESTFLTFGSGEVSWSVADQAAFLRTLARPGAGLMLKAVVAGEIIGVVSIRQTPRARVQHVGELGLSVLRRWSHLGVGRALCERAIAASARRGISRVELKVREDNDRAIRLYQALGFVTEARLRRSFRVDDQLFDEHLMVLMLDRDQGR